MGRARRGPFFFASVPIFGTIPDEPNWYERNCDVGSGIKVERRCPNNTSRMPRLIVFRACEAISRPLHRTHTPRKSGDKHVEGSACGRSRARDGRLVFVFTAGLRDLARGRPGG